MSAFRISAVEGLELLDSRGQPTLQVAVTLGDGTQAVAGVPAAASTDSREAAERRDHDTSRYSGKGVADVAATVRGEIAAALVGPRWSDLPDVDNALSELDGTPTKRRLGANAVIGTSLACASALASAAGQPLWQWLSSPAAPPRLPVPHFNVLNGGAHAGHRLDFQEFMLAPLGAPSYPEALRAGAGIYHTLRGLLTGAGHPTGLGDEGGSAPDVDERKALDLPVTAIDRAGCPPGRDGAAIALDPAATGVYPTKSIEDGLAEDDWDGCADRTTRDAGYPQMISYRSGETADTFIADLAAGSGCGQLKSGPPVRGERVAKCNRLLEIAATEPGLPYRLAAAA